MRVLRLSRGQWLVVGLILVIVALLVLPAAQTIHWVGYTDLEIEFVVTDAETDIPVPAATVYVHSEGGFYAERERQDFELTTNEVGTVTRLCKDCMCFGTSGWNIDTYVVHLPDWYYRVSAPGYVESALTALDVLENVQQVQRGKPAARLVVQVRLEK